MAADYSKQNEFANYDDCVMLCVRFTIFDFGQAMSRDFCSQKFLSWWTAYADHIYRETKTVSTTIPAVHITCTTR